MFDIVIKRRWWWCMLYAGRGVARIADVKLKVRKRFLLSMLIWLLLSGRGIESWTGGRGGQDGRRKSEGGTRGSEGGGRMWEVGEGFYKSRT